MSYNGSGTFNLYTPGNPVVTGTTISSTWANNTLSDIATGLSTAITKNGQTTVTANIPMSTFKFTGLGAGSSAGESVRYEQLTSAAQNGGMSYVSSVSGTNTITGSVSPTLTAYTVGQAFRFIPANTNTGATTLNINSVGAGAVQLNGAALVGGEIRQNVPVEVLVTATTPVFEIIGDGSFLPKSGGTMTGDVTMSASSIIEAEGADVASASSCNIWATDGNTVHITGTTGINDFATAPQAGAWMKLIFDGAVLLTQSANLNLNAGGSNITTAAGDLALVYADTTTQMDVFIIRKSGGLPIGTQITTSLSGDVNLNNTASYFNGPQVAQGTVGTWLYTGTVTLEDVGAAAIFDIRITDGTTIIDSTSGLLSAASNPLSLSVSGILTNPAGTVTLQAKDRTNTTGALRFNYSGNSKDCTLTAVRIG